MKKRTAAIFTAGALLSATALAVPISLPAGPIYLRFSTQEQFSKNNDINNSVNPASVIGPPTGNWGIVGITSIERGTVLAPTGSDIAGGGATIFSDGQNGGQQILGTFYQILNNAGGPPDTATGGKLDLYYWTTNNQNITAPLVATDLVKRGAGGSYSGTAESAYLGFTCAPNTLGCTFLARFNFTAGADLSSQTNTIFTAAGLSDAYLSVDTTVLGPWTNLFNSDFFTLNPANQSCGAAAVSCTSPNDLRVDTALTRATGWDVANTDIIGLTKNGTLRAFLVPEPDSLLLLGMGLAGICLVGARHATRGTNRKLG
jgi:hypothetical protein